MSNTNTTPLVLILPRPMRQVAAQIADRIARKGHGLSPAAREAVEALLAPCDRVELTYLQAVTLMSAARVNTKHRAVVAHLERQLGPQLVPSPREQRLTHQH